MKLLIKVLTLALILSSFTSNAEPTKEWIIQFVKASENSKKPNATEEDIEVFLAMMSDDILDVHVQYDVEKKGKEKFRKSLLSSRSRMIGVKKSIEDMILGSDTAVVVVNEESSYYKNDIVKNFKGRTILVLHFNKEGVVKEMRRFLHQ